jgi:hypothetical protein
MAFICPYCAKVCGNSGARGTHKRSCYLRPRTQRVPPPPAPPVFVPPAPPAEDVDMDDFEGGIDMGGEVEYPAPLDPSDLPPLDEVLQNEDVGDHALAQLHLAMENLENVRAAQVVEQPMPSLHRPAPSYTDTMAVRNVDDPVWRLTTFMDHGMLHLIDTMWGPTCDLGVSGCEAIIKMLRSPHMPPPDTIPSYGTLRRDVEKACERPAHHRRHCGKDLTELGWPPGAGMFRFYFNSIEQIMREQLVDPEISKPENMAFEYKYAEYVYELHETRAWKYVQSKLPPGCTVYPVKAYSDDTRMDFNSRFGYKSWVAACGNYLLAVQNKTAAKRLLGFFPSPPADAPNIEAQHRFYQWVLSELFAEINELSDGVFITVHGVERRFVPVLFVCPSDWPEGQDECTMFKGAAGSAQANCRTCECRGEHFLDPARCFGHPLRTEAATKETMERFLDGGDKAAIAAEQKRTSQYFVKVWSHLNAI